MLDSLRPPAIACWAICVALLVCSMLNVAKVDALAVPMPHDKKYYDLYSPIIDDNTKNDINDDGNSEDPLILKHLRQQQVLNFEKLKQRIPGLASPETGRGSNSGGTVDDKDVVTNATSDDDDEEEEEVHYLKTDPELWPIDLNQYKDYVVVRIQTPRNINDAIEDSSSSSSNLLKSKIMAYLKTHHVDIWSNGREFVDLKIRNTDIDQLIKENNITNGSFKVIINDLPQRIFETYSSSNSNNNNDNDINIQDELFFKEYRPTNTIYAWFDLLAETYSSLMSIVTFGTTFEGQPLKALYIDTSNFSNANPNNKTIVITAGIHAREWISISSANYILFQLLTNYGIHKAETDYLNQLNILIVPVFNPDGYSYTWSGDRLWRKNRQETFMPRCFGIDIDHSFNYHFSKNSDNFWPCDEDYAGEEAFEALEAFQFGQFLNSLAQQYSDEEQQLSQQTPKHLKIYGFLDLHSYAQEVLYPYAYSCDAAPRDKENLIELGYGMSKAIRLSSGKYYEVLPACEDKSVDLSPGLGSGSALDYMYYNQGVGQGYGGGSEGPGNGNDGDQGGQGHWAFQIKLRDSGNHGFLLPSKFILPVGEEVYEAVKYFLDFILNPDL